MTRPQKKFWWAALLTVLAGIGGSLYLTILHYQVLKTGFTGRSACNLSSLLNCDIVLSSRFSSLGTLPLAGIGLLFYLYVLGALIYARLIGEAVKEILALPYFLAILSFLFSLFLAYESFFLLQSVCIFCSSLYFLNLLLVVFLRGITQIHLGDVMKVFKKISWSKSLGYLGAVFLLGGIVLHANHRVVAREVPDVVVEKLVREFLQQPSVTIDTTNRPFWGNPNAKIVVVEFSDYECPYCKLAAFNLKPTLADYRDRVKLVFMNYPIDQACNPNIKQVLHQRACVTAAAAYCAGQQGKFWEYHDEAFDRQPRFQDASLLSMAKNLKLNIDAFQKCLTEDSTRQAILADIEQGDRAKLEGTPAIYINGRVLQQWRDRKLFHAILNKMLE